MKKRMYCVIVFIILIGAGFGACQKDKALSLNGTWESIGYGRILEINDSLVAVYDICETGCNFQQQLPRELFNELFTVETMSRDSFAVKNEITVYEFSRSEKDHELCKNNDTVLKQDPIHNFKTLWHTFNEQYCYFEERNIDWEASKTKYGAKINADTNPLELFIVLEEMLDEINDGHVYIDLPGYLEATYEARMKHDEDVGNEGDGESNAMLRESIMEKIAAQYLKNPRYYNKDGLIWGMINEDIAYIQVNSMVKTANYEIPDSLNKAEFWSAYREKASQSTNFGEDLRTGARFIMDAVIPEISQAKACILDLRFNGGGYDIVGLEILNHFTSKEIKAFTKKARFGDGFTKKQPVSLYPSAKQFSGKTYILTSNETASAAEIMVLSSMAIPNVTRIGSVTEGVFSDILTKALPNGWEYGLSNEIYESFDGKNYENIGISPHYPIQYPKNTTAFYKKLHESIKNGDEAIETVIRLTDKKAE